MGVLNRPVDNFNGIHFRSDGGTLKEDAFCSLADVCFGDGILVEQWNE